MIEALLKSIEIIEAINYEAFVAAHSLYGTTRISRASYDTVRPVVRPPMVYLYPVVCNWRSGGHDSHTPLGPCIGQLAAPEYIMQLRVPAV